MRPPPPPPSPHPFLPSLTPHRRKHFIPLSASYAELYNIQTFFTGFPGALASNDTFTKTVLTSPSPVPVLPTMRDGSAFSGDHALRDIAEAGREWRQTYVRKADMEVSFFFLSRCPWG